MVTEASEASLHVRSRAELQLFKSMAATSRESRDDVGETRLLLLHPNDFTSLRHPSLQLINVFRSSSKPLGRLGESALHSRHLQGAAIHRWLRPAVRSSGPHWPVWHEYVTRIPAVSSYNIVLTPPQTTASRTCLCSPFLHP